MAHKMAVPPPRNVGADTDIGRILPAILARVR